MRTHSALSTTFASSQRYSIPMLSLRWILPSQPESIRDLQRSDRATAVSHAFYGREQMRVLYEKGDDADALRLDSYEAIGDQLIIEVLPADAISGGGVHLSLAHADSTGRAIIASVGPRVTDPMLKVGAQVVFAYYHGSEIKNRREIGAPETLAIHECDIMAVEF